MSEMEALPKYTRKTIFEKVFQIAEYSNLTKEEREMYNASVKQKWDERSIWETAINEGILEHQQQKNGHESNGTEQQRPDVAR